MTASCAPVYLVIICSRPRAAWMDAFLMQRARDRWARAWLCNRRFASVGPVAYFLSLTSSQIGFVAFLRCSLKSRGAYFRVRNVFTHKGREQAAHAQRALFVSSFWPGSCLSLCVPRNYANICARKGGESGLCATHILAFETVAFGDWRKLL